MPLGEQKVAPHGIGRVLGRITVELCPCQAPVADHVCPVMSFVRSLFAVVPGFLPVVSAVELTPGAQDLIDEITDSRMILGERFSEVSRSLREAIERRDAGRTEQALQRYLGTLNHHLAVFEALADVPSPAVEALRRDFIAFLQWQGEELPWRIREAVALGGEHPLDPARRRTAIQDLMEPFAKQERQRLEHLDELARRALLPPPVMVTGEVEQRSWFRAFGGLVTLFFFSVVGVGGGMWVLVKGSRRGSPRKGEQASGVGQGTSEDPC